MRAPPGSATHLRFDDRPIAVRVDGLRKQFRARRTLADAMRHPTRRGAMVTSVDAVTLHVKRGEFFGLLGPNGAGKTTLLRMLAAFVTPDAGDAWVEGVSIRDDPAAVRGLVAPVIASERSLYWRLSARENLELFGALWRVPPGELVSRVRDVLEVVGLMETGPKLVGQFSSGMMQRLLIARALLAEPRVLLLDEPTRSLDPVSARDFRHFLRDELVRRRDCAVVLATHSAEEAFDLCDRVAVLDRGRIVAMGEPGSLARELAPDRYRAWVRDAGHPALAPMLAGVAGPGGEAGTRQAMEGWTAVELEVPGGPGRAAEVLRHLVMSGVEISAFERAPVSLAALIESAVRAGARP